MPYYAYKALRSDGRQVEARTEAKNVKALKKSLRQNQQILFEATKIKRSSIHTKTLAEFLQQFTPLVANAVPIDKALQMMAADAANMRLETLAKNLYALIKQGASLSHAMRISGGFDAFAIALTRAGEESGTLPHTLERLEQYYKDKQKFRADLISSLAYPAFLLLLALASLVALSFYVIPAFESMFHDDMNILPWHSRLIFAVSIFLQSFGGYTVAAASFGLASILLTYQQSNAIKNFFDGVLSKMPGLGHHLQQVQIYQVLQTLGILLSHGVPLMHALRLAQDIPFTTAVRQGIASTLREVGQGIPLYQALQEVPGMPPQSLRLIAVGEETANLAKMCLSAAAQLHQKIQRRLGRLSTLLGPVMILGVGLLIGFVVMSMLSAVYSYTDVL